MHNHEKLPFKYSTDRPLMGFQELMKRRVQEILLVSSVYDSFILAQDGQLNESMLSQYLELNLLNAPVITRVSEGKEALDMLKGENTFDVVIITMHLGDMHALDFARKIRELDMEIPVILLTYNARELEELIRTHDTSMITKIFLWQGDFRILLAVVKYIEDRWNVAHDTRVVGVQTIILVEDNIRFYSSFLPIIYAELMKQSQSIIGEGINMAHKQLRMRARPKILLSSDFESAWNDYLTYEEHVLGIISDVQFPHKGKSDRHAGAEFVKMVKQRREDIPIVLQSFQIENKKAADIQGVAFIQKNSPVMLNELRNFMTENFGFGAFVFRMPDGREVDRAQDLKSLRQKLHTIPAESLKYHGERNHFSIWFKARTEFELAEKLKPRKVSDYKTLEDLRAYLIDVLRDFREEQSQGTISDFQRETFDDSSTFTQIGRGSLGGKARGLAFVDMLLNNFDIRNKFEGIKIYVPPMVVLATDVFDNFMDANDLWDFAINSEDDEEIKRRFLDAHFPEEYIENLVYLLETVHYPIAVRSSSLLEDSQYLPFAGIYETHMLANSSEYLDDRQKDLLGAIKRIYASTFYQRVKAYIEPTPYRLEEEKMAVIIQKIVGNLHNNRFYPHFAGVARSHNYYPTHPLKSTDGIAAVCLGLGELVVGGGAALRFSPKYPKHIIQFSNIKDYLDFSQKEFLALNMEYFENHGLYNAKQELEQFKISDAMTDGTLSMVGSIYSPQNDAVYDGLSREGMPIVTFAPILKHKVFPLPDILKLLTSIGYWGMNTPVEIEFAVNAHNEPDRLQEFGFLQMRPLVVRSELEELEFEDDFKSEKLICASHTVLGNGKVDNLKDIVLVDINTFNRSDSRTAAREVGNFNAELMTQRKSYLLIGVGRWGSADPWLGIPVTWEHISGAKVIVETSFKDFQVTSSQGTHFFQNLTSLMIGYFTINTESEGDFLDWDWFLNKPVVSSGKYVKHIRLKKPLIIKMNGYQNKGVILTN